MKITVFLLLFWIFPLLAVADVAHQNDDKPKSRVKELIALSIDELLNVTIITASRTEEKAEDVPASVVVIGRDEIEKYGYRSF
jgi:outer membrane cobalamin receptor